MRTLNIKSSIFILLLCTILIGWVDPASDNNEEGVQLYNEEKHDEAISKFTDAQSYVPESQSLNFNIANTHYKTGKFPEAEKSFKDAMKTKDNTLKSKANYNIGNTMYKQGKFKEALDFYKKAIGLTEKGNMKDKETASIREDAKYNYEFVQKKMEEMQKEQQERQDQEEQEDQEKDKQEQQEQQEQEKQEQEQQEKDKQQPEEKDPDQQKQQDEQSKGGKNEQKQKPPQENEMEEPPPLPHEKREMTKEEAERILEAMKQAEMAARNEKEKKHGAAQFSIEKNW
jgi:Ca-activated chloride channel family protein